VKYRDVPVYIGLALMLTLGPVAGCRQSVAPAETPRKAASRLLAQTVLQSAGDGDERPYDESATAGEPQKVIAHYSPGPVPAPWAVEDDLHVRNGLLFASMKPSELASDYYVVPILQDGRLVSEFDMVVEDGKWEVSQWLAEARPAGLLYNIQQARAKLTSTLGPGTQTKVALFLPSGLYFVVGHHGSQEAAVYLTFSNAGPGVTGYDKYLPTTGTLYSPDDLRGLLTPGGPGPVPDE
jgi:hypothetical protein